MINKYLERELKENFSSNEVFECLPKEDLEQIKNFLNQTPLADLLVEFDEEKLKNSKLLNLYPHDSEENIKIWEELVAIKILKAYLEKFKGNTTDLAEQEEFIYNRTEEEYKMMLSANGNARINSDKIKSLIYMTNTAFRLNFVIKGCKNKSLYNAVSSYLDDKQPTTMIYCNDNFIFKVPSNEHSEKKWPWDVYDYIFFDKFNDGIESSKMRSNKVLNKKYE